MPKALELKLKKEANKHKNWSDERKNAYVFGTLRNTGWVPSTQKKSSKKLSRKVLVARAKSHTKKA